MKISHKLRGLLGVPLAVALVMAALVWHSHLQCRRAIANLRRADEVVEAVFALDLLTRDCMRSGNERARTQWRRLYDKLGELLDTLTAAEVGSLAVLTAMRRDHERLLPLFDQLLAARDAGRTSDLTWQHLLAGQIQVRTHALVSNANEIRAGSIDTVARGQQQALAAIAVAVGFLAAVGVVVTVAVTRSILRPLKRLEAGTRELTGGNYAHRVAATGANELSRLAEAFNAMAASVESSHAEMQREMRDRREAEEWARTEMRRAERYLEVSKVITVELDCRLRIVRLNPAGCEWLDLPAGEVAGKGWLATAVPEDERHREERRLSELLDTPPGPPIAAKGQILTARGSRRTIAWNHAVLADPDGRVTGLLCSGNDITEQLRTAEELRRHRDELEQLVSERTADLQRVNEQLRLEAAIRQRAQRNLSLQASELERSNSELEQFAYVTSHDLQEPLRGISGCLQLLAEDLGDRLEPENRELIDHAVRNARRMKELINDLLTLSRVDTAGDRRRPHDLNEVLRHVLENLGTAIEQAGADIRAADLPTVTCDGAQMLQLFQNLLGNAVKFHGQQPPEVRIQAARDDGEWHFTVRDNGIGFSEEFRDRIFVIFQRLHDRHSYPGTGIGLALCKRIVERHGGRIWAESPGTGGAAFHFTIPDREAADDA